jgi:AraC family transcriptional regulator
MKEAFTIVGLQLHSSMAEQIPSLWDELVKRQNDIKHKKSYSVYLGVIVPTEKNMEFNYIAGMEVTSDQDVPEGMVCKTFPANRYAVFTHKGSLDKLMDTFQYIHGTWFPKNGYCRGNGVAFELYDDDRFFGPMNDQSEVDIYIPIEETE